MPCWRWAWCPPSPTSPRGSAGSPRRSAGGATGRRRPRRARCSSSSTRSAPGSATTSRCSATTPGWTRSTPTSPPHGPGPSLSRPVAFHYESTEGACGAENCAEAVLGVGTPVIWYGGLAALIAMVAWYVATRDSRAGALLLGYAAGWLPWFYYALADNRTMYLFYAITMLPFMILALPHHGRRSDHRAGGRRTRTAGRSGPRSSGPSPCWRWSTSGGSTRCWSPRSSRTPSGGRGCCSGAGRDGGGAGRTRGAARSRPPGRPAAPRAAGSGSRTRRSRPGPG